FAAIPADRALIETAVTGIEHDRLHAAELGDHVRAQLRLERFGKIDARDDDFPVVDEHGKAQPIAHAVEQYFPTVEVKLHFILAVVQIVIFSVDCRVGATVELRDIIDDKKIEPVDFDQVPLDRDGALATTK